MKTLRRAFTLIEMLTIITIISILASILLPAIQKAREKGRQANCQNNLHQLSIGWIMYRDDHNQTNAPFLSCLYPHYFESKEAFLCKSDSSDPRGSEGGKPDGEAEVGDQFEETDDTISNSHPLRNNTIEYCSYFYEMSAADCSWSLPGATDLNGDGTLSWAEVKEYQLVNGDSWNGNVAYSESKFPVIRCYHHHKERRITDKNGDKQGLTLNVAYDGNVFAAPLQWELAE